MLRLLKSLSKGSHLIKIIKYESPDIVIIRLSSFYCTSKSAIRVLVNTTTTTTTATAATTKKAENSILNKSRSRVVFAHRHARLRVPSRPGVNPIQ